jgi:hypothetical protein
MVLTKHLYDLREVRAALLWSIKQRRRDDTLFWLNELEDSCYGSEAGRLLWIAWMLWIGLTRLAWLAVWEDKTNSREGRQMLARHLISCSERDSSLWIAICAKALKQDMIWKSYPIAKDQIQQRLGPAIRLMEGQLRAYAPFGRIVCDILKGGIATETSSWIGFPGLEFIQSVEESSTIMEGRTLAIPYDCLFGMTQRGQGTNTADILRCLTLSSLKYSPVWKNLVPDSPTDSEAEEFWDTYFPWNTCDHPDEWPLKEQEKSHGLGVTGSAESPLSRWWRNWVSPNRILIKGSSENCVKEYFDSEKIGDYTSVLDRFLELLV